MTDEHRRTRSTHGKKKIYYKTRRTFGKDKEPFGRLELVWEDNIKTGFKELGHGVDSISSK
jgi:hypothetical protein